MHWLHKVTDLEKYIWKWFPWQTSVYLPYTKEYLFDLILITKNDIGIYKKDNVHAFEIGLAIGSPSLNPLIKKAWETYNNTNTT